ncbi:MAG: preprotein translocase subunit SecG [Proteobacteria bacterium]|nr:preprotein translocase subunit SecG [Pseudomonadota bacterium]
MTTVILVIHLLLAIALVCVILLQRSEGGVFGMGGGGMGGFMTGRATADLLTRTTTILAAGFMATSMTLAILSSTDRQPSSILDQPRPVPLSPAQPSEPSVPLAK